ncbi:sensor histidine kinase [Bradyrhizobium sp. USDA 10063]
MTAMNTASLRSRLVRRLISLQAVLLVALVVLVIASLWASGCVYRRDEGRGINVLRDAVARNADGTLFLHETSALKELRDDTPDLWFVIHDKAGHSLSEGDVPPAFTRLGGTLGDIGQAKFGWDRAKDDSRHLSGQMKLVDTAAGEVQIIATSETRISDAKSLLQIAVAFFGLTLPGLALMALATLVATPLVIRNALAGLDEAAHQAGEIDIDKRGARLPVGAVPTEIAPLVSAVNDALGRLDEGYERHRRFLADAAHELRTPIAILTTRLEGLPQSMEKARLIEDVSRLSTLTEQLLDLQRLEQRLAQSSAIDLAGLCAQVIADLAPLAIAAGYEISLQHDDERIEVWGDRGALERAVVNLVQNAIQHGGHRGAIVVAVSAPATIEVRDQGPGIPASERERIFEPFHRLQPQTRGAGLGLNLVREIINLHRGEVTVTERSGHGACFRISLPPIALPAFAVG